jgi:hypothetical protein
MTFWWLFLFLAFAPLDGLQRIALRNQFALQAESAYNKKNYLQAAALYERVRQTKGQTPSPAVLLNLAHSYFQLHEYSRASPLYRALLKTQDPKMLSLVTTQLSIIEAEEGNFTKAVNYSIQAMKADETNDAARYNYELLQKYLLLHPEKRNSPPPPRASRAQNHAGGTRQQASGGSQSSGENSPAAGGTGSNLNGDGSSNPQNGANGTNQQQSVGNEPGQTRGTGNNGEQSSPHNGAGNRGSNIAAREEDALLQTRFERLKKLQLTPEKARQLLDAMRQEEAQYLQQVPRKTTKKKNSNDPDW